MRSEFIVYIGRKERRSDENIKKFKKKIVIFMKKVIFSMIVGVFVYS